MNPRSQSQQVGFIKTQGSHTINVDPKNKWIRTLKESHESSSHQRYETSRCNPEARKSYVKFPFRFSLGDTDLNSLKYNHENDIRIHTLKRTDDVEPNQKSEDPLESVHVMSFNREVSSFEF